MEKPYIRNHLDAFIRAFIVQSFTQIIQWKKP